MAWTTLMTTLSYVNSAASYRPKRGLRSARGPFSHDIREGEA